MTVNELLREGAIGPATDAAIQTVKTAPGDISARIVLFELLAVGGQWDRAAKHLDVVLEKAPTMIEGIVSYRGALQAELDRSRLFEQGAGAPQQMTAQPLAAEPTLAALRQNLTGAHAEAKRTAAAALDATPARAGTVDGTPFEDLRDADDLLAPYLEAIGNGRYGWVPLAQIQRLDFQPPKLLRDLLWRPTTVTMADGMSSTLFVPVRYPGSERHTDNAIQLGRSTDWVDDGGPVRGLGQRAFAIDGDLRYLLEINQVVFS